VRGRCSQSRLVAFLHRARGSAMERSAGAEQGGGGPPLAAGSAFASLSAYPHSSTYPGSAQTYRGQVNPRDTPTNEVSNDQKRVVSRTAGVVPHASRRPLTNPPDALRTCPAFPPAWQCAARSSYRRRGSIPWSRSRHSRLSPSLLLVVVVSDALSAGSDPVLCLCCACTSWCFEWTPSTREQHAKEPPS
jgi:hypothetical protein